MIGKMYNYERFDYFMKYSRNLELFLYLFRRYWDILEVGFCYFGKFSFKYGSNQLNKKIKLNKINPKENVGGLTSNNYQMEDI
jgi:hypothetical protein